MQYFSRLSDHRNLFIFTVSIHIPWNSIPFSNVKRNSCCHIWKMAIWLYLQDLLKDRFSPLLFIHQVVSDSSWPHRLQCTRVPCPSPSPGVCPSSRPFYVVMPSDHLILCHPVPFLPSFFPSIRVFSNESTVCIRWPNYWDFSFSISPFSPL